MWGYLGENKYFCKFPSSCLGWSKNYLLALKFGTWTNLRMLILMVMFIFTFLNWARPLWANLVQKIKIVFFSWNLVPTILSIIFWIFATFYKKSDTQQVKQYLISSINNIVYELPHELPNDLSLTILGIWEVLGKCQNWEEIEPSDQSFFQNETFVIAVRNYVVVVNCPILKVPVRFCLISLLYSKYFVQYCTLIRVYGIQWWCSFWLFLAGITHFEKI